MNSSKPKLLWADDDQKQGRFRYEEKYIERKLGWECTWAHSQEEATELLAIEKFDALILDQQLPLTAEEEYRSDASYNETPWQGCVILYWLRGSNKKIENVDDDLNLNLESLIAKHKPLHSNRNIPVTIMTSYYSSKIVSATIKASPQDVHTKVNSKPVEIADIEFFLKKISDQKGLNNSN